MSVQTDGEKLNEALDLIEQVDRTQYPEPVKAALTQAQESVENAANVLGNADYYREG